MSIRGHLFARGSDAVEDLARVLAQQRVLTRAVDALERLSPAATVLICGRLAEEAAKLTDVRLADVLRGGWQRYAVLANAALRTLKSGGEEVVDLATHRITSEHHPHVDVLVDGVKVGSVPFELRVVVDILALVATVAAGRLSAVEAGRCQVSTTLACHGIQLAEAEEELDLGAMLDLGAGIPLVPGVAADDVA